MAYTLPDTAALCPLFGPFADAGATAVSVRNTKRPLLGDIKRPYARVLFVTDQTSLNPGSVCVSTSDYPPMGDLRVHILVAPHVEYQGLALW